MEKHPNPFDDFLKQALKGHQLVPPENAKKAFLKEASTVIPTRKSWNYWYYLPILILFISGIVAVLNYQSNDEITPSAPLVIENVPATSITDSSYSASPSPSTSSEFSKPLYESKTASPTLGVDKKPESERKSFNATPNLMAGTNTDTLELKVSSGEASQNLVLPAPSFQNNPGGNDILLAKTTSSGLSLDSLSITGSGIADTVAQQVSQASEIISPLSGSERAGTPIPSRTKPTSYFTAGVYYLPELMFNTLEDSKFVNNFGFEAIFYRGQISIRTGAGISVSKGISKNSVEYNDYLGTYNKLDSITFIFNEPEHNFIPNLFISREKVWDSESKLDSSSIVKRYTYLQIPLILGFDFWQKGRFTTGVRVGTIMSVLLNSHQLSEDYNPGDNQVVGVNMITPEQVKINWQAIGGINVSVGLRKNIYLEIEPQAKYYYQSIYEKSDITKKPWSVGVRAAFRYIF